MNTKRLFFLALAFVLSTSLWAQSPFITTWNTENTGVSASNQITIPTTGTGYNYSIYWEDISNANSNGNISNATGDVTITFPIPGIYKVSISGAFPRIYFADKGDLDKLLTVEQWGDIAWTSMESAFEGCHKLDIPATDAPDLSQVESLAQMFLYCNNMNGKIGHWNVSTIKDMNLMFCYAAKFNQDIGNWDVSNVTNMTLMFQSASTFNQDIGNWNVSNVTSMYGMFYWPNVFNQDISRWNVSKVTNMSYMFLLNRAFNQDISGWDVSNVQSMTSMFERATSFNQDLSSWNIGKVTKMEDMLDQSGMSVENYDATLVGWSQLPIIQNGVQLGADQLKYCGGESARQSLIDTYNWTINGDLKDCISINGTLGSFTTTYGTASFEKSFTVFGASLSQALVLQVPESYEVSTTPTGSYQDNLSLIPVNGKVSTTTVYIRLKATVPAGTVNAGTITVSTTDYADKTLSIPSGSVSKASLIVTAEDQTKTYGAGNPIPSLSYSGFVNGDNASDITIPLATTNASTTSGVGNYTISLSGGYAINYQISRKNGTLTVTPALLTITVNDAMKEQGEINPPFTLSYSGFVNSQNQSVLGCTITPTTTAVENSIAGFYDIVATDCGFTNPNYTYQFVNGILTVAQITGIADQKYFESVQVYPNPSVGKFKVSIPEEEVKSIRIINMLGEAEEFNSGEIETKLSGFLILEIQTTKEKVFVKRIEVIK